MRLPHHPELNSVIRPPSADRPWSVLISGCLFGQQCGTDGTDYGLPASQPPWLTHPWVTLHPICPEHLALGTPRAMPDLHGGDGFDVLDGRAQILDEHGNDHTAALLASAQHTVALAQQHQVAFALLTDRSAACGSQVISVGCRLRPPVHYRLGVGVVAASLIRAGIPVVSQRDHLTLARLGSLLDSRFGPKGDEVDFHHDPWVLANLGS